MNPAFAAFDEPHAWLIRGLVEYGWFDVSRTGGHIPQGAFGGFNLTGTIDSEGREGLVLEVPAVSGGRACTDDGSYNFQVQVSRGQEGSPAFFVRCPEANYFQEFPYDPANPTWAPGYIHQALTDYVPQFVTWRLAGGEVSWSQRAGTPTVEGEPCSFLLTNFLRERVQGNRPLHNGPAESWWFKEPEPDPATMTAALPDGHETPVQAQPSWTGAIAVAGKGDGPTYMSAQAREAVGVPVNATEVANVQARALAGAPGAALLTMTIASMAQGVLLLINALSVVIWYRDAVSALIISLLGALILLGAGFASLLGALSYRKAKGGVLPWFSMLYVALVPGCCLAGLPVAIWAGLVWNKPMVVAARK